MHLNFKVYHSLAELPSSWNDALAEDNALHSTKIGVTELALTPDIKNYYVQGFCPNNTLVFQAYSQQLQVHSGQFNLTGNKLKQWFIRTSIDIARPKLLVAGNLFRHDVQMLQFHKRSITALDRSRIVEQAIDYMMAYTKSQGVFIKDIPKPIAKFFLTKKEYQRMDNDIAMYLDIPPHWTSFEDYQNELKRKYRNRAKSTRKSFEAVNVRNLSLEEIISYKKEMHELYKQVTKNQVVSMGELSEDFISELKKSLGETYQVTGFFIKENGAEKMIAFSSAIIHDGVHDMNYIGFDYALNQKYSLYFNMLFHCVACAIGNRCHKLLLGRTALEAKAIVGCEPDYLYTFYKLKSRFINEIVKNITARFENRLGEGWENRHPFKAEYYEGK
jgi:hypothetical protein